MKLSRAFLASIAAGFPLLVGAEIFPYQQVGAFGRNNQRDVSATACDFVHGCYNQQGELCKDNPNEPCVVSTVPPGRCSRGSSGSNIWPQRGGFCEGTTGTAGTLDPVRGRFGIPCLPDAYIQAYLSALPAAETNLNALDNALRKALLQFYPSLKEVRLIDYKVRVVDEGFSTGAVLRVLIESTDGLRNWSTVGSSENVIEASWMAPEESTSIEKPSTE